MHLSRRDFTAFTSVAALGTLVGRAAARPHSHAPSARANTYFDWKPIGTPEGQAWAGFGEGGNTLVVASKGELLLVDTKFAAFAAGLRREALDLLPTPKHALKLVINTHHHGDHTGGNLAFSPDTPILAHEKAKPRIESQIDRYKQQVKGGATQLATPPSSDKPGAAQMFADATKLADTLDQLTAAQYTPTTTFATEHEAKIGDALVQLHHFGTGHTDNDAVVLIPSLNILHMGDLLFHNVHPFIDVSSGSNSTGWMDSCRKAAALCDDKTVVVPGHGELTDKAGLLAQITYFEAVRAAVKQAIDAGLTKEDTLKLSIDSLKNYGTNRLTMVLGAIYDELKSTK